MRRGLGPTISDFRQYVLARANGFDDVAAAKENIVIQNFEAFCRTELAELARRCSLTQIDVGNMVARLAVAWRSHPPPLVPFNPPTLNDDQLAQFMPLHGWQSLSGKVLTTPVTAIVTSTVRGVAVDIFARDGSSVCHKRFQNNAWSEWKSSCAVGAISQQAIVQYSQSCLAVYAKETDNKCKEMYFGLNNVVWCGNNALEGSVISAPSALCNFNQNASDPRTDLFAIGDKNECIHNWWMNDKWQGWETLGGFMMSQPVAVWVGSNSLHVFALGKSHDICHKWWDGTAWKDWESLGGRFTSKPAVVAQAPNCLEIFAIGTDHSIWHKSWDGTSWGTSWVFRGETSVSVQCVSVNPNRLDIFVVGTDGACKHRTRNAGVWGDWQCLWGMFVSEISAVSLPGSPNQILVFGVGTDSVCWYRILN